MALRMWCGDLLDGDGLEPGELVDIQGGEVGVLRLMIGVCMRATRAKTAKVQSALACRNLFHFWGPPPPCWGMFDGIVRPALFSASVPRPIARHHTCARARAPSRSPPQNAKVNSSLCGWRGAI